MSTQTSTRWAAPFFILWTGQAVSLLGSRIAGFALVWWLTESTGSAVVLSIATLMFFLPQVVLGPFAGALVDRWNRRRVMLIADLVSALAATTLALLFWVEQMQVWHVYVTTFVTSLSGIFHFSAMTASTSLMVPEQQLTRVQGANQMLQGLQNIIAPPIGALLVGILPFHAIMGLDVITASFAIAPLLLIAIPQPVHSATAATVTPALLWADVRSGFRYVWEWRGLFYIALLAMLVNFMATPTIALTPILVTRHFNGGALQLSWMDLAFGLGLLGGGILLGVWGGFRRRMLMMPVGLIGFGVGALLIGLSPASAFWLALSGMALFGIMSSLLNGSLAALMQTAVAPEMQGRVFSALGSGASAMAPLALVVGGPLAEAFGPQVWFLCTGMVVMLVGCSIFFIPAIIQLEEQRPGATQAGNGEEKITLLPQV